MLELPRTLLVDDDKEFSRVLAESLALHSPEMAVQRVATLGEAIRALGGFRPHIVFLNWKLSNKGDFAMGLLRGMSDLMEREHATNYKYPFFLHRNWTSEDRESWEKLQEVTDSLDNPFKGLRDQEPIEPLIHALYERRIQHRRVLKLNGTFVPLGRCAYIRISDPGGLHFWDVDRGNEITLERHRKDNFQVISEHLVSLMSVGYPMPGIRSLFVKANERNQWVNLAFTKSIERDTKNSLVFVLTGGAGQVTLTDRASQAVIRTLEYLKQHGAWSRLEHLSIPS